MTDLWTGIEETLTDDQLDDWAIVRDYSEEILRAEEGRLEVGVSNSPRNLLINWSMNAIRMNGDSLPMEELVPIADSYAREGKSVLERYANTDEELEALSAETKAELAQEMLRLQERFHRQIAPFLNEEQRAELSKQRPLFLEFKFGRGVKSWGRGGYF